jgi:hypothetical protein
MGGSIQWSGHIEKEEEKITQGVKGHILYYKESWKATLP